MSSLHRSTSDPRPYFFPSVSVNTDDFVFKKYEDEDYDYDSDDDWREFDEPEEGALTEPYDSDDETFSNEFFSGARNVSPLRADARGPQ